MRALGQSKLYLFDSGTVELRYVRGRNLVALVLPVEMREMEIMMVIVVMMLMEKIIQLVELRRLLLGGGGRGMVEVSLISCFQYCSLTFASDMRSGNSIEVCSGSKVKHLVIVLYPHALIVRNSLSASHKTCQLQTASVLHATS